MTSLIQILRNIQIALTESQDPRSKDWILINYGVLTTIMASYLYFCTKAGPKFMESRKPFELKNVLMIYNAFQVAFSGFLIYKSLVIIISDKYSISCQPANYSDDPYAIEMLRVVWIYYVAKLTELLDTIFFVLRKKQNQISFLHLVHHFCMPIYCVIAAKYFGGGHYYVLGTLNSTVHVVMYTYYLIAGLGPQYEKYLWWKKHVTTLQLFQFTLIFLHNFYPLFTDCKFPKVINLIIVIKCIFFMYMFGKFYVDAYWNKSGKGKREDKAN